MKHLFFSLAVMAGLSTQTAQAAEGQIFGGPVGGTDIRNAYIPSQPGFYFSTVGVGSLATKYYDQNGNLSPATNVNASVEVAAVGVAYVYPFQILGANATSGIQGNYQAGYIKLNGRGNGLGALGDPYVELLALSWNLGQIFGEPPPPSESKLPYGLVVKTSYSMILPLGYYNAARVLTPGKNDVFYIPNFAATYLFGPNALGDGLEIDAHLFIDVAGTNPTTRYATGLILDTDFAISERTGRLQWGIAGYYAKQIQNDEVRGSIVSPFGKRLEQFYLGPVIAYDFPEINATIKLKIQSPIEVKNSLNTNRAFLTYAMKF